MKLCLGAWLQEQQIWVKEQLFFFFPRLCQLLNKNVFSEKYVRHVTMKLFNVCYSNRRLTPVYLSHPHCSFSQYILRGSPFKTNSTPLFKAEGLVLLAPERRTAMLLQKKNDAGLLSSACEDKQERTDGERRYPGSTSSVLLSTYLTYLSGSI